MKEIFFLISSIITLSKSNHYMYTFLYRNNLSHSVLAIIPDKSDALPSQSLHHTDWLKYSLLDATLYYGRTFLISASY